LFENLNLHFFRMEISFFSNTLQKMIFIFLKIPKKGAKPIIYKKIDFSDMRVTFRWPLRSKYRNYTLGVFVPKAQPRDTNIAVGIIPIWYFNNEHIINARSVAEGILPIKNATSYLAIYPKSIKYIFWTICLFLMFNPLINTKQQINLCTEAFPTLDGLPQDY